MNFAMRSGLQAKSSLFLTALSHADLTGASFATILGHAVLASPLFGATLEIDPAVFSTQEAAFLLEDSTLRLSDLSILLPFPSVSELDRALLSVIAMRGRNGAVYVERVAATLDAAGRGEPLSFVDTHSGQRPALSNVDRSR